MAGRYRRPTTPAQQAKAAEAREAKLAGLHQTLTEQVSALASGPQWRRWLDVAAKFHNYSFNNTLLLLAQKPDATQVAGYNLWQELGRQVVKGEKGLAILAPVTRKIESDETNSATAAEPQGAAADSGESAATARRVVGFRPVYVWDVSQTSGDPLPAPPMPQLLAGQAPEGLWDALTAQCTAAGFTVTRKPVAGDAGPNGYTAYATHEVVVRSDVDGAQAVKTLAHELGHVLMHDPAGFERGQTGSCRGDREVEAESLAYLVAADHGLDTAEYTFAYVAGWAAQTGDVDAAVRASGARVLGTAHSVLDRTHEYLAGDVDAAATATSTVAVDRDELSTRTAAGAARTEAIRQGAEKPVRDPEHDFLHRDRLAAANSAAAAYYASQYPASWAPAYLDTRLGTSMLDDPAGRVGYAPPGWTHVTEHLRGNGFTDAEILGAGLGTRASTGRVIDRFRDRLMFPIQARTEDGGREIVGFVGRRNPSQDASTDTRNPKYLNTGHTPLYTKGEHLYGLAANAAALDRGGLAVLVEGPIDALAVDLAAGGMMAGLAPLGTALTEHQARQLADTLRADTDADPAGVQAAGPAYDRLTAHSLDPRGAALPPGTDPAQLGELHGPAALLDRLARAEPIGRQLVDHALNGRDLTWPEDRVAAARIAAGILAKAPLDTWQRELTAVTAPTGLQRTCCKRCSPKGSA